MALACAAGADHVIDYTQTDFAVETRHITGGVGVAVVYDSVGKDTWERGLAILQPRGYLVIFGASSGPVPPIDLLRLMNSGSLFVTRPTLVDYTRTRAELRERRKTTGKYCLRCSPQVTAREIEFRKRNHFNGCIVRAKGAREARRIADEHHEEIVRDRCTRKRAHILGTYRFDARYERGKIVER